MQTRSTKRMGFLRPTSALIAFSLIFPLLAGCGGKQDVPPPVDDTKNGAPAAGTMNPAQPAKPGMSTGKKVVIVLAGAALLYYLYKHHQKQNGEEVQYYKSKANGRIYYRDSKTHQAHWVTPAPNYEVDENEAKEMSKYQGYNNNKAGEDYQAAPDASPQPQ